MNQYSWLSTCKPHLRFFIENGGNNNKTAGEPERLRFKPGRERLYCLNARGAPAGNAEKTKNSLIKDTSDEIMINYRG